MAKHQLPLHPQLALSTIIMLSACLFTASGFWWDKPKQDNTQEQQSQINQPAATQTTVSPTYLDTLNRGKEVSLTARDLQAAAPIQAGSVNLPDKQETAAGFRIQLFASSQIEMIRTEKKNLEAKFNYPLYIVFTSPYYKLLLGDFAQRSKADSVLTQVRSQGYPDAWVVASTVSSAR
jgi:hypothetical protein